MNNRERFRATMAYEPVDRPPVLVMEPYEETALERWRAEGLPHDATPENYLGMSRLVHLPISFGPIPGFPEELLSEDEQTETVVSGMGATIRRHKQNPSMFYGHIDHPVKSLADWREYRERFRADTPGRIPSDWAERVAPGLNASEDPVGLCLFPFFFRLGFYALGMERFLCAFHDEPALIREMFADWSEFVLATIAPLLESVALDYALIAEDLAGKNGPLISPSTYAEFWYPYQDPIVGLLQDHGVPVICQWSAGEFNALLPSMMDHGFNCTWPMEVMAGMDVADARRQFGRQLRLGGGIAKEAVIAGPDAIDVEIDRLMPAIREGGLIPALDDMASPDMPFDHFRYLVERLQEIRLDR